LHAIFRTALLFLIAGEGCTQKETSAAERLAPRLCLRESPTIPFVVGDTATLEVGPVDATDSLCLPASRSVAWRSSNTAAAPVDARGLLRAVQPGRATITATTDGDSASATFLILPPIRDVRIMPDSVTLGIGDSATFHVVISGTTPSAPVWWYSNDALISFARPGARDPAPVSVTAESVTVWAMQPGQALLEAGTRYLRDAAHVRIVVR
jgi:hypothetical protein